MPSALILPKIQVSLIVVDTRLLYYPFFLCLLLNLSIIKNSNKWKEVFEFVPLSNACFPKKTKGA
eukprot:scaffold33812_cov199-Amphora_coffeaeformis.AAC.2